MIGCDRKFGAAARSAVASRPSLRYRQYPRQRTPVPNRTGMNMFSGPCIVVDAEHRRTIGPPDRSRQAANGPARRSIRPPAVRKFGAAARRSPPHSTQNHTSGSDQAISATR